MIISGMIIKTPSQLAVRPDNLAPRMFNKEMEMIKTAATSQDRKSEENSIPNIVAPSLRAGMK
jgi:hypothetical protein